MNCSEEDYKEFKLESLELLDQAEHSLLALEKGASFKTQYDAIFRAFHSVKGAAGMIEFEALQNHVHHLETTLMQRKDDATLDKVYVDFFLKGSDAIRTLLDGGTINFSYEIGAPLAEKPAARPVGAVAGVPRVFVIDDEPAIVEIICEMLQPSGYAVHGFTRPEEVPEAIRKLAPDIILTDLDMPKLDGMELLNEIRQISADLPVVFISGRVTKDNLVASIPRGVTAVIEKPFSQEAIVAVVEDSMQRPRPLQLLAKSIDLIMYQYSDLDSFLKEKGEHTVRETLQSELNGLLEKYKRLTVESK